MPMIMLICRYLKCFIRFRGDMAVYRNGRPFCCTEHADEWEKEVALTSSLKKSKLG